MTQNEYRGQLLPNYEPFLFAEIEADPTDLPLSVLSLFGRLGHDPWAEAVRLGALPPRQAALSLAEAISGLPNGKWTHAEALTIAERLVAMLPAAAKRGAAGSRLAVSGKPVRRRVVQFGQSFAASRFYRVGLILGGLAMIGMAAYDTLMAEPVQYDGSDVATIGSIPVPIGPFVDSPDTRASVPEATKPKALTKDLAARTR